MAINKERKNELVKLYVEMINKSRALFLTEYSGLSVKDLQKLRANLREVDGAYLVTKNTLLKQALQQTGRPIPEGLMVGQLAAGFAFSEVPALAKVLSDFAKEDEDLAIKFGIMGDAVLTADQVDSLAKLPSRDELRAQIIGMLQAPARNIAATVASGVRQIVNVLDAYAKKDAEAEAAAS